MRLLVMGFAAWAVAGAATARAQGIRVDLQTPLGGEQVAGGSVLPVRWEVTGLLRPAPVRIEYRLGIDGEPKLLTQVEQGHAYDWRVPVNLNTRELFLQVTLEAGGLHYTAQTLRPLVVDSAPPTSRILGMRETQDALTFDVDAADGDGTGVARLVLYGSRGGAPFETVAEAAGSLTLRATLPDGRWRFKVGAVDRVGNVERIRDKAPELERVLDRGAPTLTVDEVPGGLLLGGETRTVRWRAGDELSTAVTVTLLFSNGADLLPVAQDLPAAGELTWTAPPEDLRGASLVVQAQDESGNRSEHQTPPFALQAYPPRAVLIGERSARGGKGFQYRIVNLGVLTVAGVDLYLSTLPADERQPRAWTLHPDVEWQAADAELIYRSGIDWQGFQAVVRTVEGQTDARFTEPPPEAGAEAELQFFEDRVAPAVRLAGLTGGRDADLVLRGGTEFEWRWDPALPRVDDPTLARVALHYSVGGSPPWRALTPEPVANDGRFAGTVPGGTSGAIVVRASTRFPNVSALGYDYSTVRIAFDDSPPYGVPVAPTFVPLEPRVLPYRVFDVGEAGVADVRLWQRAPGGDWRAADWQPHQPAAAHCAWAPAAPGVYELYLQGRDTRGNVASEPAALASREAVVTTRVLAQPVLSLRAPVEPQTLRPGGTLALEWEADGADLADDPFFLQYRAAGGPWQDIVVGLDRTARRFVWRLSDAFPDGPVEVRLGARNLAGGEGFVTAPRVTVTVGEEVRAVVTAVRRANQQPIIIEYQILNRRPDTKVQRVSLWYTRDEGQTWTREREPDDNAESPFQWAHPPAPGEYGLSVTCIYDGILQPEPKAGSAPQLADQVLDWIAPVCELNTALRPENPVFAVNTPIDLHWRVRDDFLDRDSVRLDARVRGADWRSVPLGSGADQGTVRVTLPAQEGVVEYRLGAKDRLGNVGESPLTVRVLEPKTFPLLLDTERRAFRGGETVPLRWDLSAYDRELPEAPYRAFFRAGETEHELPEARTWAKSQQRFEFPAPSDLTAADCALRLVVRDVADLEADAISPAFAVLSAPPQARLVPAASDARARVETREGRSVGIAALAYTLRQGEALDEAALPGLERLELWTAVARAPEGPFAFERPPPDRRVPITMTDGRWVRPPLELVADHEGYYGLALVAVDRVGATSVLPAAGMAPQHVVEVDLGPPVVRLVNWQDRRVRFTRTAHHVLWDVRDLHLIDRPVALEVRGGEGGAQWRELAARLPNDGVGLQPGAATGGFLWLLPTRPVHDLQVRVRAATRQGLSPQVAPEAESAPQLLVTPYYAVNLRLPPDTPQRDGLPLLVTRVRESFVRLPVAARFDAEATIAAAEQAAPAAPLPESDRALIRALDAALPAPAQVRVHYRQRGVFERQWKAADARPLERDDDGAASALWPIFGDGEYEVYLTARDHFGNEGAAPGPDTRPHLLAVIDTQPPTVRITNKRDWADGGLPAAGRVLRWVARDAGDLPLSAPEPVRIRYSADKGITWRTWQDAAGRARFPAVEEQGVVIRALVTGGSAEVIVQVEAEDDAGWIGRDELDRTIIIDATPPVVASVPGPPLAVNLTFPLEYRVRDLAPSAGIKRVHVFFRPRPVATVDAAPQPTPWQKNTRDEDASSPAVVTVPGWGLWEFFLVAEDRAGNRSAALAGPDGATPAPDAAPQATVVVDPRPLELRQIWLPMLHERGAGPLAAGRVYDVAVRLSAPYLHDVVLALEYSLHGGQPGTWQRALGTEQGGRKTIAREQFRAFLENPAVTLRPVDRGEVGPPHGAPEDQVPDVIMRWRAPPGDHREVVLRVTAYLAPYLAGTLRGAEAEALRAVTRLVSEPRQTRPFELNDRPPLVELRPPIEARAVPAEGAFYLELVCQGNRHRQYREWDHAIRSFERALEEYQQDVEGHYLLALTLRERGDPADRARLQRLLTRALFLNPAHARSLVEMGLWYEGDQRWDDAIESYRGALGANAGDLQARFLLGRSYYRRRLPGDLERAFESFSQVLETQAAGTEALRKDPETLEYYWATARLLRHTDRADRAFETLAFLHGAFAAEEQQRLLRRLEAKWLEGAEGER